MLKGHTRGLSVMFALLCSVTLGLFMAGPVATAGTYGAGDVIHIQHQYPFAEAYLSNAGSLAISAIEVGDYPDDRKNLWSYVPPSTLGAVAHTSIKKEYRVQMLNRASFVFRDVLFPTHYFL